VKNGLYATKSPEETPSVKKKVSWKMTMARFQLVTRGRATFCTGVLCPVGVAAGIGERYFRGGRKVGI